MPSANGNAGAFPSSNAIFIALKYDSETKILIGYGIELNPLAAMRRSERLYASIDACRHAAIPLSMCFSF